jgi:AcrR family transcriptional regulator
MAASPSSTNLRADAARNLESIVSAADRVFRRGGLNVSMDEVAAEANVGIATVYRRFPSKEALLKAVLDQHYDQLMAPALQRAERERDPRKALMRALEAGLRFAVTEQIMFATAANIGLMTMDLAYRFFGPVAELIRRGQDAGVFRADLVADDTPRIMLMIVGTLPSFEPDSEGWRRYLQLLVDGLAPGPHVHKLVPADPVRDHHARLLD